MSDLQNSNCNKVQVCKAGVALMIVSYGGKFGDDLSSMRYAAYSGLLPPREVVLLQIECHPRKMLLNFMPCVCICKQWFGQHWDKRHCYLQTGVGV